MKVIPKVFRTTYRDSFVLMRMASMIRMMEGVKNAELMQGTEPNKSLLSRAGLLTEEIQKAGPHDLCLCIMAKDETVVQKAGAYAEEVIQRGTVDQEKNKVSKTLNGVLTMLPKADLAFLSIPGPCVKREALKALRKGLNLFIFSDNVRTLRYRIPLKVEGLVFIETG